MSALKIVANIDRSQDTGLALVLKQDSNRQLKFNVIPLAKANYDNTIQSFTTHGFDRV